MDEDTIKLLLANRSFLYNLVARAYACEPDAAFLEVLRQTHTRDEIELVRGDDGESRSDVKGSNTSTSANKIVSLFERVLKVLGDPDVSVASFGMEYVCLFVGPGVLRANPWESMHRSGKRVLFQREVLSVREAYRSAGFLPQRFPAVADDFIGLEMDFLAKLSADAFEACECKDIARCCRRLQEAKAFLKDHLLHWIDSLAASMEKEYGEGFYSLITWLAAAIAERDVLIIDETLAVFATEK